MTAMSAETKPTEPDPVPAFPTEADIDAVLYEAKGDARVAIRMLLVDLDLLARDYNASVSHGYVYGRLAVVRGDVS
jgi:hypothetical protein